MSGSTFRRLAPRLPGGLLGLLALLIATEGFLRAHRLDFATAWTDDWKHAGDAAATGLKKRDVLILGDSLVKYGVLPKEIEVRTGLKSYNLALNAGQMPATYFLLRRALEAGARPKAIVADFLGTLKPDPDRRTEAYANLVSVRDCLDLAWTTGEPDVGTRTLLGKCCTAFRARFAIRAAILGAFVGLRASAWPAQAVVWKTWDAQDGAQPTPPMPWGCFYERSLHDSLVHRDWQARADDAVYIEKFLALAEAHKIPVFWLIPPLSPQVYAERLSVGTDEAYDRMVRATVARHPGVTVLDARNSGYDDSVHIDLMHLEVRGARVLSADLADILADRLIAHQPPPLDRFAALPAFANRTGAEPGRMLARSGGPVLR